MMKKMGIVFVVLLLSCGKGKKIIIVAPSNMDTISDFIHDLSGAEFKTCFESQICSQDGLTVILEKMGCEECYEFDTKGDAIVVKGSSPSGIIYGLTRLLEEMGYRFPHPFYSFSPPSLNEERVREKIEFLKGNKFEPEIPLRGLHLHTLHPIEGLFSFWLPSPESLEEAKKIIRWIMRLGGNYIQWVALNDIEDDTTYEKWKAHTEEIIQYAHKLGMKTGINVQIFSESSFQNAFLMNEESKIEKIVSLPFDIVNLSFGEFIGNEPQIFIEKVNEIYEAIKNKRNDVEITATVHVGNFENLWVNYAGKQILYYFLVKYANPDIIPLVHTVMFYNLFDTAGGAYNHKDFSYHRDFLFEMMENGRETGYFPETAYWIAFDNSVPLFLPVYIISRWKDLNGITKAGDIYAHILFSSGWEWGYWLNDYSSLKFSYTLPATWTEFVYEVFSLFSSQAGDFIKKFGELEYQYLIKKQLAPYLAGEDFYIYLGCRTKIFFSQPCRISFGEIKKMSAAERENFVKSTLTPLSELEQKIETMLPEIPQGSEKIVMELKDGAELTYLRTKFIKLLYETILHFSEGENYIDSLEEAEKVLLQAKKVANRRKANLFYPRPQLITQSIFNPTIYQFGYLKQAQTLCLWERDIKNLRIELGLKTGLIPLCIN